VTGSATSRADRTRVDLHVKVLDERVVERATAAGLDVLVYAPHFTHLSTVCELAAAYTDEDLLVVPAREYFTGDWRDRRHVLAIDPDRPIPDFLGFEETLTELAGGDGAVLAPHPEFLSVGVHREEVATHGDVFDAVEVYNPKYLPWHVDRARTVARDVDLPGFASSYAHLRRTVGEVFVEFDTPIDSAEELTDAIADGGPDGLYRRRGPGHDLKRAAEVAHLGWENSWKKFDRIVLGGTPPTHPHHPNYDGAFDARSVY